jgi:hypothetical protein
MPASTFRDDVLKRDQRERVRGRPEIEAPKEAELNAAWHVGDRQELIDGPETAEEAGLAHATSWTGGAQRVAQHAVTDQVQHGVDTAGDACAYLFCHLARVDHDLARAEGSQLGALRERSGRVLRDGRDARRAG